MFETGGTDDPLSSSGGSSGDSGTSSSGGSSGSSGSSGGDGGACAAQEAVAERAPAYLYFVFDVSGSMGRDPYKDQVPTYVIGVGTAVNT